jgi:hypothetical protein
VIGVINDVHLDPYYNSKVDEASFCRGANPLEGAGPLNATFEAKYGRHGCDPNDLLIRLMLKKLSSEHSVDVLLMNGDFAGHKVAVKPTVTDPEIIKSRYAILKDIMSSLFTRFIQPYFNNTVVLPCLGNNDI